MIVILYYIDNDSYKRNIIRRLKCDNFNEIIDLVSELSNINIHIISENYEVIFSSYDEKYKFRTFNIKYDNESYYSLTFEETLKHIEERSLKISLDCKFIFKDLDIYYFTK